MGLGPSPGMAHLIGGTQPNPPPGPISQREKSPQGHYAARWVMLPIPEMEGKGKRVSRGNLAQGIGPPPVWLGGLVTSIGRKSLPSRPPLMHLPPPEQPVPPLMTPGTCEPRGEVCCGAQRLETAAPFPAQLPSRWRPNPAEATAGSRPLHLTLDFFLC